MRFQLNAEESIFCTVGEYSFTYGQEQHDIDLVTLPDQHLKQLWYNVTRSVLMCEEQERLEQIVRAREPAPVAPSQPVQQVQHQEVATRLQRVPKDPIQEDLKALRAILRKTVASVKKEAVELTLGRQRRLLELEKETKNRKSVVGFLEGLLSKHSGSVVSLFEDTEETEAWDLDPLKKDPRASTQVGEVIESEEEEMIFPVDALGDEDEVQE